MPDINPFIRTKLDERPLDLAEFAECHQLLEELEKQKKSLAADVSKGSRPINRQSVRGSVYSLSDATYIFQLFTSAQYEGQKYIRSSLMK